MLTNLHFCSIGFGYSICANNVRLVGPVKPKMSQRIIKEAKKENRWVDATRQRQTKSFILMDDGMVITSPFHAQTLLARLIRCTSDFTSMVPPVLDKDEDDDVDEEAEYEEDNDAIDKEPDRDEFD